MNTSFQQTPEKVQGEMGIEPKDMRELVLTSLEDIQHVGLQQIFVSRSTLPDIKTLFFVTMMFFPVRCGVSSRRVLKTKSLKQQTGWRL